MHGNAIKNSWTVDDQLPDRHQRLHYKIPADRHLIHRLVAFFATGDSIVSNNLVLNLYQHPNAPEARMYLSRQLYEEALQRSSPPDRFDNYSPTPEERQGVCGGGEHRLDQEEGRLLLRGSTPFVSRPGKCDRDA